MKLSTDAVEIFIPGHIKQSRPGYKVLPVLLKAYAIGRRLWVVTHSNEYIIGRRLWVVTHSNEYIERTKSLRSVESRLFISYVREASQVSL